jgi:uncharacterized protein YbaR (Trm112 family)
MKENYLCPHCKGSLNVDEKIVFSVRNKHGNPGLIFLHPELGNYEAIKNESFSFEDGEHLEYRCPICHKKLASDIHDNLARIIYVDEANQEFHVLFSMIAGEQSTFKMVGDNAEVYGEHTTHYLDLLGMR